MIEEMIRKLREEYDADHNEGPLLEFNSIDMRLLNIIAELNSLIKSLKSDLESLKEDVADLEDPDRHETWS